MNADEIIKKTTEILESNTKYTYRSWSALASELGLEKDDERLELLKIILNNPNDFVVFFSEKNYDPSIGPLFALRSVAEQREKEMQKEMNKIEKESRKQKNEQKHIKVKGGQQLYQDVSETKTYKNKENTKKAVAMLIKIQRATHKLLETYGISLLRNDEVSYEQIGRLHLKMKDVIVRLMSKNDWDKNDILGE